MAFNTFMRDDGGGAKKKKTAPAVKPEPAEKEPAAKAEPVKSAAYTSAANNGASKKSDVLSVSVQDTPAGGVSPYEAKELQSYRAQEEAVNRLYEAKKRARLAGLKNAYEQSLAEYVSAREDIAPVFEAQRNRTAAESERQRAAFNEYAAARGLNTGAAGQAELARGSVLAGNLDALNTEQAKQEAEIGRSIAALKSKYQSSIAEAAADNDSERLGELLSEYRQQEKSAVSTGEKQADEDYRAWQAAYKTYRDGLSDAKSAAKTSGSSARKTSSAASKKAASGGAAESGSQSESGSSLIETMLALGSDADAYAYLLTKGYRVGDTETMWDLYRREKALREKAERQSQEPVKTEPSAPAETPLSPQEWQRWRSSYLQGGRGDPEARFETYQDYIDWWSGRH